MTIEEVIVTRLKADGVLSALGDKVRPLSVDVPETVPFLVYRTGDETQQQFLDGTLSEWYSLEFVCYVAAGDQPTARVYEKRLNTLMLTAAGQYDGITIARAKRIARDEVSEPPYAGDELPLVNIEITYEVTYKESEDWSSSSSSSSSSEMSYSSSSSSSESESSSS